MPYAPDKKVDGQDHGFKDLRDRPHLVKFIPEVSTSEGLAALLRARGFNNGTSQNKNCAFEPLRNFFGEKDCFELILKVFAYGATPQQASAAFEHGASACATAINRLTLSTRKSGGRLDQDIILDSIEQAN